jgi:ATP-dependent protease ClpP protease subunit
MIKRLVVISFLICLGICCPSYAANIYNSPSKSTYNDCSSENLLVFSGDIISGDSYKFREILNKITSKYKKDECKTGFLSVQLDSNGGDVIESLNIGRLIRAYNLHTIVPFSSVCNSSCVFLLAAGVRRSPMGQVGIHRPYFAEVKPGVSTSEIQSRRNDLNKKIREFLDEIDVSQSLLEKMLSIPPEKIKILSKNELEELRLSDADANYDEKKTSEIASFYNLSSLEYRNRISVVDNNCRLLSANQINEYTICKFSILLQINKTEVKIRLDKATKICSGLDKESSLLCNKKIIVLGQ